MQSPPFPWRPLSSLLLALAAQALLEPPARIIPALLLYIIAIGLGVWSAWRGEWRLPSPPPESTPADGQPMRLFPLLAALALLGMAYSLFGDNRFTVLNLCLWLAGTTCFIGAFRQSRAATKIPAKQENQRGNRLWFALIAIALLIAGFYRFYRLDAVPAEPFSDHAEKILDVYDITQGRTSIFFERNTGREAIQFYWSLLVAAVFQTGLSFQSLKIGSALIGFFTLPFIYLLGREVANQRVGLLAMLFAGIAYWANVISRIGLRFPLQPFFVAPTFYFLLRGLRTHNRNDFILSGLFLGFGLHGYTPFRIVPLLVVVTFLLYAVFTFKKDVAFLRRGLWKEIGLLFSTALVIFLPLLRYATSHLDEFWQRTASRAVVESPLPVFFTNLWKALLMFNLDDGTIFVNSVVHRPALDVVTGALFALGLVFLLVRRRFHDLWLVAALLILILPSVSSLAFPGENPALNRASGALIPVFILVGMALDGLLASLQSGLTASGQRLVGSGVAAILFITSGLQNYDLVFRQFDGQYRDAVWQTSEMGKVIREFGNAERVWIIPYDQWIDTRLPGIWAGIPNRDFGLPRIGLADTLQLPAPKLFIFKASPRSAAFDDAATREVLQELYPQGGLTLHEMEPWWQSFWVYFVPAD